MIALTVSSFLARVVFLPLSCITEGCETERSFAACLPYMYLIVPSFDPRILLSNASSSLAYLWNSFDFHICARHHQLKEPPSKRQLVSPSKEDNIQGDHASSSAGDPTASIDVAPGADDTGLSAATGSTNSDVLPPPQTTHEEGGSITSPLPNPNDRNGNASGFEGGETSPAYADAISPVALADGSFSELGSDAQALLTVPVGLETSAVQLQIAGGHTGDGLDQVDAGSRSVAQLQQGGEGQIVNSDPPSSMNASNNVQPSSSVELYNVTGPGVTGGQSDSGDANVAQVSISSGGVDDQGSELDTTAYVAAEDNSDRSAVAGDPMAVVDTESQSADARAGERSREHKGTEVDIEGAKAAEEKRVCAEACERLLKAGEGLTNTTRGWSVDQLVALRGSMLSLGAGLCGRALPRSRPQSSGDVVSILLQQIARSL